MYVYLIAPSTKIINKHIFAIYQSIQVSQGGFMLRLMVLLKGNVTLASNFSSSKMTTQ